MFVDNTKTVYVHQYKITVFEQANESYRALRTELVEEVPWNLANTFEQIKRQLIKQNRDLPNPAAYLALSKSNYPAGDAVAHHQTAADATHRAGGGVDAGRVRAGRDRHLRDVALRNRLIGGIRNHQFFLA